MIRGLNKIGASAGLGYMMSGFSKHPAGPEKAYQDAVEAASDLIAAGLVVFAPIVYSYPLDRVIKARFPSDIDQAYLNSHEFWMTIDERFYERCDYGIIAMTPGWSESKGIAIELAALTRAGVPVHLYDVDEMHIYNLDEARVKWPDDLAMLINLAIINEAPGYLPSTLEAQSDAVADIIDNAHAVEFVQ